MNKYIYILAAVYLYIFGILFNYENAWMHTEVVNIEHHILTQHSAPAARLKEGFNWSLMENSGTGTKVSRPRPFSYLILAANTVLRNWLFRFIPPHPSLSITWIVALVLSPLLLYRLIFHLSGNKETAWMGTILYLSLPGSLIPIIMLFHPGKVFTNFFFIFCLYLASRIQNKIQDLDDHSLRKSFLGLVAAVFFSFFFDEYSLFIFILIPLFFPKIFHRLKSTPIILFYLSLPVLFVLITLYVLPGLYATLGFPGFNFLNNPGIKSFPWPNPYYALINFILLLQDNLLAGFTTYLKDPAVGLEITNYGTLSNRLIHADNIRIGLSLLHNPHLNILKIFHHLAFFGISGLFLYSFFKNPVKDQQENGYLLRSFIALLLFTIFFSFLHTYNYILSGCAWYGCSFSVLFAIFTALLLNKTAKISSYGKILTIVFFLSLTVNSLYNTKILNTAWMLINQDPRIQLDVWLNRIDRKTLHDDYQSHQGAENFLFTYLAWENRHDQERKTESLNPNAATLIAVMPTS